MVIIVVCENLVKIYKTEDIEVVALQGLDLTIEDGELMAIIGTSGSGKSTFLNILGGLDRPTAGTILVDGKNLLKITDKELIKYRRNVVGFMWQNNARNLIPYLTAIENVELPMFLTGKTDRNRALELLDMVGMVHRKNSKLDQLSGGEQQRIAMAIALASNPKLFLADEPTGAVDTKTASQLLDVFRHLNETLKLTIVIVTHDRQLSRKVNRVVAIRDGMTSSEFLMKKSYTEEMKEIDTEILDDSEGVHEELTVLDQYGRIQIPKEFLITMGLTGKSKVKVQMEGGHIVVRTPNDLDGKTIVKDPGV